MGKAMAYIVDHVIQDFWWCNDDEPETETLVDVLDRPLQILDTYIDGRFYHDGVAVLTNDELLLTKFALNIPCESSSVATRNYPVGSFLSMHGIILRVIWAIPEGCTIGLGHNVEMSSLDEYLISLQEVSK